MKDKLIRDSAKVLAAIHVPEEADISIAKEKVIIHFPKHYMNGKLGHIDDYFNPVAFFAIIVGDYYAVSKYIAWKPLSPDSVSVITIDGMKYYELTWEPGSTICPNTNLVMDNQLVYTVDNEIHGKGKTPWYLNRHDLAKLLDSSVAAAGVNLGANHAILELSEAIRARKQGDLFVYARTLFKTQKELDNTPVEYIPMNAVAFAVNNTMSRTLGANFRESLVASMVDPSTTSDTLDTVLRA